MAQGVRFWDDAFRFWDRRNHRFQFILKQFYFFSFPLPPTGAFCLSYLSVHSSFSGTADLNLGFPTLSALHRQFRCRRLLGKLDRMLNISGASYNITMTNLGSGIRATILILLLAGIGVAGTNDSTNPAVDKIFADITKPGSPGCALAIYRDGKIIYEKGYGLANLEQNVPITPHTVFDIASVSKQFTAASILLLEKQGKLRLEDDVRKYIPELPDYSQHGEHKITILHLLNHASGLRDYVNLFSLAGINIDNVTTEDDALGMIVRQKGLNFSPGSDWAYSNSGYLLLSLIVKRVSGKTLKDFAAENIFQPLEMLHTQYRNDHTALIPNRALAYEEDENGYKLSVSYGEENGDGMVHTTVEDLQKWDENFYSPKIGGKEFAPEMEQQTTLNDGSIVEYAKGLFIGNYRGLRTVRHSGGSGGYRAYMLRFPDQHFSIACLCNLGSINRLKRLKEIADMYLSASMKPKEEIQSVSLTPEQLQAFAGSYLDAKSREVSRVSVNGGKLWIDLEGSSMEFRPTSSVTFEPVNSVFETHVSFEPASKNTARRLIVSEDEDLDKTFNAIQVSKPTVAELEAYAGDYWSEELRVTYRLRMKDGKLRMQDMIRSDGIAYNGDIPSGDLNPFSDDKFDLNGAPIFHFKRDAKHEVTGFILNEFSECGIVFEKVPGTAKIHSELIK
ncbi:MAG: hypothetical protein C5B54_09445 [Acidobacteria bacterium]|nr:MAG: hypothetical protein C5B54_09445 [Acidobacteriota bacterium]